MIEVVARSAGRAERSRCCTVRIALREEARRAARLRFERDRRRFIVARARLRRLLADRLGLRPESLAFVYGKNGKPAVRLLSTEEAWGSGIDAIAGRWVQHLRALIA